MQSGELIVGKYRLKERLGVGGMGEVWSAQHTATDREFAIKFMHGHVASSEAARQRFSREARASARINHPNIIDVFDVGEHGDGLFLVMEMLDGISLSEAFYMVPPLSVRDLVSVLLDTARALAAAHAVGIIHRDIKPGNVFLHRDRVTGLAYAKLLDFGISKFSANDDSFATKTGSVLGSPRYMSPEQARSASAADHRADIWSVGVILFEGVTGVWPHEGDSFSSLVVAIATTPPLSIDTMAPQLPDDLRCIIRDCLSPIEDRMSSALELAARLEAVLQNQELGSQPLPRPLKPMGEGRTFTTGGHLKVGLPPPSQPPQQQGSSRASDALKTARQPFGLEAARAAADIADAAARTARQPFGVARDAVADTVGETTGDTTTDDLGIKVTLKRPPLEDDSKRNGPPSSPTDAITQPLNRPANAFADTSPTPFPAHPQRTLRSAESSANPWRGRPAVSDPLSVSVSSVVATVALPPPQESAATTAPSLNTIPSASRTTDPTRPTSGFGGPLGIAAAVLAVMAIGIGIALVSVMRGPPPSPATVTGDAPQPGPTLSPTPSATAPPAPIETAEPAPTPAESASAAPSETASAAPIPSAPRNTGVRPLPSARPKPPGNGDSKLQKLGSGL